MKIISLTATFLLLFNLFGLVQTTDYSIIKKNSIYAEGYVLRPDFIDGYVSINYERNIGKKRRTHLRIGITPENSVVTFPINVSWITNPLKDHHFEYGIGIVMRIEHYLKSHYSREWFYDMPGLMIPLMYRYQKSSGWFFRGGINSFVSWGILASPSFSVGYKF